MDYVERILTELADLVERREFRELETDGLELKPVPAQGAQWKQRYISVNAFLNTRGGILILGVKEEGAGPDRHYVISGWQEHAANGVKEMERKFTDRSGNTQDLGNRFPPMQVREMPRGLGRVGVVYVDELAADRKFVFYEGDAYKRVSTGDHKILIAEIEAQEEFRQEARNARELQPVLGLTESDLDLAKLNLFIFQLNQPTAIETIKSDWGQARPFLERRCFIKDGSVTILGALVCAKHPDHLGFRSQVHGYVDAATSADLPDTTAVVQDKQDFVDNVLQLMEKSLGYVMRNIQVGVSPEEAGVSRPQYPAALLRETINNALAHRDYSIDRPVILSIRPGKHISIQNPGKFRSQLLIQAPDAQIPIRRILPEAKPRNPKLADVLRVFRKWEGRGIGMATLVNLCLRNEIDIPYYRLLSDEVRLYVCAGKLVDERMLRLFQSFNGYLEQKLNGATLSIEQQLVLSYLMKSEWQNRRLMHTILLTPDNNHFDVIDKLERANLISKHEAGSVNYPVYIVDRVLMRQDYLPELRTLFGSGFDGLPALQKQLLGILYRYGHYSKERAVSAKQASFALWYERENGNGSIEQFDAHYRKVRYAFNKLEKYGYVDREPKTRRYLMNESYGSRAKRR